MKSPPGLWLWLPVLLILVGGGMLPAVEGQDCSKSLGSDMDETQLPCDDFYQHACGHWDSGRYQRHLGVHDARSKWVAQLKELLIGHFESEDPQANASQLGNFYRSCFSSLSNQQSLDPYTDAMARSGAHFHLLDSAVTSASTATRTRFDWTLANAELRKYGANGLWRLLVQDNWQSAEQRIFYILPPKFDLLGEDELSEFLYQRYVKSLLIELRVRVRRALIMAQNLVDFERRLSQLLSVDRDKTLVLREPQSLAQLDQQLPELQLRRYFEILLKDMDWEADGLLLVVDMDYLQHLQRFLRTADQDTLSTWLLLKLPMHFEFKMHDGASVASQRDYWVEQLRKLMPGPLGRLQMELLLGDNYQEIYDSSVQQVAFLFRDLKQQFELLLNETAVFENDSVTRSLARDKLRSMRLLTPRLQDPSHAVTPLGGNCDENLMQLSRNRTRHELRQVLGEPPATHAADPLLVNSYYRLRSNRIELPLGLLATPLLQQQCDRAADRRVRLAAGLGYILAHEMLHAFDYDGINYDAAGQAASGQWPPRAIIRLGLRAACYLGARYSNATLTMNENIADSEGLRVAFESYRREGASSDADPNSNTKTNPIPDRELWKTFFVVYAQNWCGVNQDAGAGSSHAGHAERVNNVLGNMPEFAEAFQCKDGSRMNPADKCRIW